MTPFLEARGAARWFHAGTAAEVRAVDGVDLAVPRGAFVLLRGPSGSGKTTLLALLGALERPTRGTILVDGIDPAAAGEGARSRIRRRLGFAFPGGPMIPRLPLWENVTLGLVPRGVAAGARREAARGLLAGLGLEARLRSPPEELSTGELQRASLARALAGSPEALLVDEPLANLDPAAAGLVAEALSAFRRSGGTAVVATHGAEAFPSADDEIRLEAGRRA